MSSIPAIHTSCKKCVCAIYENITQVGCYLDYISKYKDKNTSILEAYDNEKEFYVIGEKKCPGYREDSWFKNTSLTTEEKIDLIKQSNSIDYLAVIDLKNISIEDFEKLTIAISNTKFKPTKIIIIRHTTYKTFPFNYLRTKLDSLGIIWRIQTMVDQDALWGDILHEATVRNVAYRFICGISKYKEDMFSIIDKANSIIYDDLSTFNILCDQDHNIIIYAGSVYRYANYHGYDILNDKNYYQIV
jgi:hypothetical protein